MRRWSGIPSIQTIFQRDESMKDQKFSNSTLFMRGWTQCFIRQHLSGVPRVTQQDYINWFWKYWKCLGGHKGFKHHNLVRSWRKKKIPFPSLYRCSVVRDYQHLALKAGWLSINGIWINKGCGAFEGTAEELCWHIGIGHKWRNWKRIPY